MRIALVTLAYGSHLAGARVLFHSLRKHGGMPSSITPIVITPFPARIPFAESVVVTGYNGFPTSTAPGLGECRKKLAALTMDYHRIIFMDSDILCVGDCSLLWSSHLGHLPFYAARDYGAIENYPAEIAALGLQHDRIFNSGVYVYNRNLHPTMHDEIVDGVRKGTLGSYNSSDQGLMNCYIQDNNIPFGFLPPEYNYCLAATFPQMPIDKVKLAHFVGPAGKPWQYRETPDPWSEQWRQDAADYLATCDEGHYEQEVLAEFNVEAPPVAIPESDTVNLEVQDEQGISTPPSASEL